MTRGAQRGRRQRRFQAVEVHPGRRLAVRQRLRRGFRDAGARERLAGDAGTGIEARSEAIDHGDRHRGGDPAPFLPAREAAQIVGAHDPDETHARTMAAQIGDGLVGVARADLCLEAGDLDARMARQRLGRDDAFRQRGEPARILERVARGHQPPDPVETEAFHRQQAGGEMGFVRRIEGAAEQPDAHAWGMRRQGGARRLALVRGRRLLRAFRGKRAVLAQGERHGLICPEPRTRYLKLVNCSTPTGPRAWKRPVAMPISAPKPNSPPSANCVEALCRTIAESTSRKNFSAATGSSVTIESVWCEPWRSTCAIAASTPSTTLAEMTASRYSVDQSSSLAGLTRPSTARVASSPRTSQPASSNMVTSGARCVGATA